MTPKINWIENKNGSFSGLDDEKNSYYETANCEVVTITSPNGITAIGWSAEDAYNNLNRESDKHRKVK